MIPLWVTVESIARSSRSPPLTPLLVSAAASTEPHEEQSLRSNNIAELSPGAINSCRSEYHAAFNSMMMERMTTDINALKRQYSRIKRKQQQQVHQVYIRAGNRILRIDFNSVSACERKSTYPCTLTYVAQHPETQLAWVIARLASHCLKFYFTRLYRRQRPWVLLRSQGPGSWWYWTHLRCVCFWRGVYKRSQCCKAEQSLDLRHFGAVASEIPGIGTQNLAICAWINQAIHWSLRRWHKGHVIWEKGKGCPYALPMGDCVLTLQRTQV